MNGQITQSKPAKVLFLYSAVESVRITLNQQLFNHPLLTELNGLFVLAKRSQKQKILPAILFKVSFAVWVCES